MQPAIITLALFVLLRMLFARKNDRSADRSLSTAMKNELSAWLLTALALAGAFSLLLVLTLFFGPIPQFHEWGSH